MKRLWIVVAVFGVSTAFFASSAIADAPTPATFSYTYGAVMTGYCPFNVDVVTNATGRRLDFVDDTGTLVRRFIHQVNVDTFSSNGKTLTSIPFVFNIQQFFDGNGNVTYSLFTG